jgi:hypothetical protein
MVGSRTHQHTIARAFGSTHNGSMDAYAPAGEMMQYQNPRSHVKYKKVTSLGESTSPIEALGGAGAIALGMIYFGMGFPGSKGVIDWTKKRIEQPYETTQYAFLGIGSAILIARAYR